MTTQNLWETAKAVLRGKFKAMQSYLKEEEKHRIDNLILHLKQLKKEGKNKQTNKHQNQQKERNHKDQAEINEK